MGSLSVSTHRGLVHWQGLLLLVSLLTFWSLPTTAQIIVKSTYAVDGTDALLNIYNNPPEAIGFVWYKGNAIDNNNLIRFLQKTPNYLSSGPENNERVILFTNGSLLLKKVTWRDEGLYTVLVELPDSTKKIGSGMLHVYEPLTVPILLPSRYWVIEDEDDVVLNCYTNGVSIQWLLNGMKLKFSNRRKLSTNGKRLTIDPVKGEDDGIYKCVASTPTMRVESRPVKLRVLFK